MNVFPALRNLEHYGWTIIGLIISVVYKCFIENKHFPPLQWNSWRRTQCQHLIQYLILWRLPILCIRSGFILSSFLLMLLLFCANPSLSVIALHTINIYFLDLFWHLYFLVKKYLLLQNFSNWSYLIIIPILIFMPFKKC